MTAPRPAGAVTDNDVTDELEEAPDTHSPGAEGSQLSDDLSVVLPLAGEDSAAVQSTQSGQNADLPEDGPAAGSSDSEGSGPRQQQRIVRRLQPAAAAQPVPQRQQASSSSGSPWGAGIPSAAAAAAAAGGGRQYAGQLASFLAAAALPAAGGGCCRGHCCCRQSDCSGGSSARSLRLSLRPPALHRLLLDDGRLEVQVWGEPLPRQTVNNVTLKAVLGPGYSWLDIQVEGDADVASPWQRQMHAGGPCSSANLMPPRHPRHCGADPSAAALHLRHPATACPSSSSRGWCGGHRHRSNA